MEEATWTGRAEITELAAQPGVERPPASESSTADDWSVSGDRTGAVSGMIGVAGDFEHSGPWHGCGAAGVSSI
jgi:hypothetical protein